MNPYRRKTLVLMKDLFKITGTVATAMDVGAGDGWFAQELKQLGWIEQITTVDVKERKNGVLPSIVYEGDRLPFSDGTFELSYAIDVLHHSAHPHKTLQEILRCTRKYLILKDHVYWTFFQKVLLGVLDEIGNRRFGIPSNYHYQLAWSWFPLIEQGGFQLERLIYPAKCHGGLLGLCSNHLQFLALWKRR